MLLKRILTALVLFGALLIMLWADQYIPTFTITIAICALLGAWEFYRIIGASGKGHPALFLGLGLILVFTFSPLFNWHDENGLLFSIAFILPMIWVLLRRNNDDAFAGWAFTVAGILYIGWPASRYATLVRLEHGHEWVILALFCAFATDTMAYFVGSLLGQHKMARSISPSKTWEGALGGLLGAIVVGILTAWALHLPISFWGAAFLSAITSIFAQTGDLAESLFKRNMGVKDSGHALPGHGGLLDRIDGIILAGIVVYYYVVWTT
ncbi:MAG: phosphatidate cytidylyltransferase [Dehalococcoidia bacterium]|nr:phosphatidate cytidylyltransferase [Dehalococcoidia bacterium]